MMKATDVDVLSAEFRVIVLFRARYSVPEGLGIAENAVVCRSGIAYQQLIDVGIECGQAGKIENCGVGP